MDEIGMSLKRKQSWISIRIWFHIIFEEFFSFVAKAMSNGIAHERIQVESLLENPLLEYNCQLCSL